VMLCGSEAMNADVKALLEARGFIEGSNSEPGTYVVEKAFVTK
jgi:ferredoxin--NADP+ reductase